MISYASMSANVYIPVKQTLFLKVRAQPCASKQFINPAVLIAIALARHIVEDS